ncbi:EscV/YscV/HrcV family type III secretion system export apparatus protein [Pseudomonas edaphica]|uniref:EscV/YscV/HrcV family type III secretion system export apparatus protein n=1 Tax=Pseudomonas edaphica TaxID=2006980 RepID=A0A5R8R0E4_9PSED|nr:MULTISPECIES: type III secretion system export apparatus subunit SctV [Pseudomonas]NMX71385.1 type III secretion system export apparatus subunit SctV [Pseudomonas sp. WS 5532]NWC45891.1 type III secretion system export apparatus subunit SctV [Pseudomonas sp. IPO3747]MCF5139487.1 EscV/YscV/HrcV family type III secretion system export apparatus protein [Pseudomonas sp. PA-6-3C]MCF5147098.1 EscV/YscV/HrcV family type III secretion system export apparatus protein [Pseudomonas sp. PA-6-3F]MCF515
MTVLAFINHWLLKVAQRAEVLGAVVVLAIVFIFIVPLPTWLVDILIALNICIACLLIVLALYLPGPLAFSSFPSILLLTTMFRLALSIATTRLILLEQDAGDIVEAFGNFVVGGNLAVGLVIFMILTLVNFLVITKGSERVAEVAARFSLDAMPGKQMSIDSDLRAGLIDGNQARDKRDQLSRESQLFGAMDGAMKFVKGDAVAGLVIVLINLLGGFSTGMFQHGMSASESIALYSVLTIGDGLIAQIPALLISLTAGMIITRAAPDGRRGVTNMGAEIARQMTSEPKSWMIASVGMLAFAALPGMPTLVFILISLMTGSLGYYLARQRQRQEAPEAEATQAVRPEENGDEDLRGFDPSRPYLLQFSPVLRGTPEVIELVHGLRQTRNALVANIGLTLPPFEVELNDSLADDEMRFCVHEVPMIKASVVTNVAVERKALAQVPEHAIPGLAERDEQDWVWLAQDDPLLDDPLLERFSATSLIVERMKQAMMLSGPQFLGIQESKSILSWLEHNQPELVQELQRIMPLSRFSAVLQRLAGEGVPLRAVRLIVESLIEYGQHEREPDALADYARIALKAQIFHQYSEADGLHAWLLSPQTENVLRESLRQTQTGVFFALDNDSSASLINLLNQAFVARPKSKSVMLVAQDLRSPLRTLLLEEFNHVPVMSFAELGSTSKVKVLGRFDLGQTDLMRGTAA